MNLKKNKIQNKISQVKETTQGRHARSYQGKMNIQYEPDTSILSICALQPFSLSDAFDLSFKM